MSLFVADRLWTGAATLILLVVLWIAVGVMWLREIGRVMLRLTEAGIEHQGRLVAWSDILNVELTRRIKSPNYLTLTTADGRTVRIHDDHLDCSLDWLCGEIEARLEPARGSQREEVR